MADGPAAARAAVPGSNGSTSIRSPVSMVNVSSPGTPVAATVGSEIVKRPLPTVTAMFAAGTFRVTVAGVVKAWVVVTVRGTPGVITPIVNRADVGTPMTTYSVVKLEPTAVFDMVTVPTPGFVAEAAPAPIAVTVDPTGI